jgi:hypothetical protein
MRVENPWWKTGEIDEYFDSLKRRFYFNNFFPLVNDINIKRAVVLMGPRRVGKTVMMHHSIEKLLKSGIQQKKIFLISIDNPLYLNRSLEDLFKLALNASGEPEAKKCYAFFDEIQYLKNWEVHLKVLVDKYPHTKFIVSGSAAAALKYKSTESGAGRFTEFLLPPLTFYEYIHLKNFESLIKPSKTRWQGNEFDFFTTNDIKTLNKHFVDYINFGGYPEVIFSEKMQSNPGLFIKSDIIDKVLLRDLPSLYGINDVQELNSFFATLAYYSGNEVSLDSLSESSGVEKNVLKKYLEYLEAAYLVKVIHRIDDTAKRFQRLNFFKVYLTNPSIRSALFSPLQAIDQEMGHMVENAIYSQWLQRESSLPRYARWNRGNSKGEVDMVGLSTSTLKPLWAVEMKWSNRYFDKPYELRSLLYFCKKNKLQHALVTTIDNEGVKNVDGIELSFHPSSLYAYIIGYNTINKNY